MVGEEIHGIGHWSLGHWSLVIGHWVIGHWVIGHWSLGHWSLVIGSFLPAEAKAKEGGIDESASKIQKIRGNAAL